MAITVAMRTQVSQLYVSLFGRAPDAEGLGFWVQQLDSGKTVAQVADTMYAVPAARDYYPSFLTNQEIVKTFYKNVLGRDADAEGLAFWTAELGKAASKGAFFEKLVNAVVNYSGTDADGLKSKALFLNKVAVAQYYGEQSGDIAGATAALNGVTEAADSVTAAKAAIDAGTGQTFMLTASTQNINEGKTVYFTLATESAYAGKQYSYQITGVDASDVVGGQLSGTATIDANGKAVIAVSLTDDATTEGLETLVVTAAGQTASVAVADTSTAPAPVVPTYSLSVSTNPLVIDNSTEVNEGGALYFTLVTTHVPAGSNFAYLITGVNGADISGAPLSGTVTIDGSGVGVISLGVAQDATTEGLETLNLALVTPTGVLSATVNLNDTSTTPVVIPTYSVEPSVQGADEGATVTYTVATSNVPNGTILSYSLSGIQASDLALGSLTGNAVVNNGVASIAVTLSADHLTEGAETLSLTLSRASTVVATAQSVVVADTSVGNFRITATDIIAANNAARELSVVTAASADPVVNVSIASDVVTATEGVLIQGNGNHSITSGAQGDTLRIDGTGNNAISTGAGNDIVTAGSGNDTITGGAGADALDGGAGNDTFVVGNADFAAGEVIQGGLGTDTLVASGTNNFAAGTLSSIEIIQLNSTATFTAAQLAGVTTIQGDGSSEVTIEGGDIDLSNVAISGLALLTIGANCTVTLSGANLAQIAAIDNSATDAVIITDAVSYSALIAKGAVNGSVQVVDTLANIQANLASLANAVSLSAGSITVADAAELIEAGFAGVIHYTLTDTPANLVLAATAVLENASGMTASAPANAVQAAALEVAAASLLPGSTSTYSVSDTAVNLATVTDGLDSAASVTATTVATVAQATAIHAAASGATLSYSISGTVAEVASADMDVLSAATNLTTTGTATVSQAEDLLAATNSGSTTYNITGTLGQLTGNAAAVAGAQNLTVTGANLTALQANTVNGFANSGTKSYSLGDSLQVLLALNATSTANATAVVPSGAPYTLAQVASLVNKFGGSKIANGSLTVVDSVSNWANVTAAQAAEINVAGSTITGGVLTVSQATAIKAAFDDGATPAYTLVDTAQALADASDAVKAGATTLTATTAATMAQALVLEVVDAEYSIEDSAANIADSVAGNASAARNEAIDIVATGQATVSQAAIIDGATNGGTTSYNITDTAANIAAGNGAGLIDRATDVTATGEASVAEVQAIDAAANSGSTNIAAVQVVDTVAALDLNDADLVALLDQAASVTVRDIFTNLNAAAADAIRAAADKVVVEITQSQLSAMAATADVFKQEVNQIVVTDTLSVSDKANLVASTIFGATASYSVSDSVANLLLPANSSFVNAAINLNATGTATVAQAASLIALNNSGTLAYSLSDTALAVSNAADNVLDGATAITVSSSTVNATQAAKLASLSITGSYNVADTAAALSSVADTALIDSNVGTVTLLGSGVVTQTVAALAKIFGASGFSAANYNMVDTAANVVAAHDSLQGYAQNITLTGNTTVAQLAAVKAVQSMGQLLNYNLGDSAANLASADADVLNAATNITASGTATAAQAATIEAATNSGTTSIAALSDSAAAVAGLSNDVLNLVTGTVTAGTANAAQADILAAFDKAVVYSVSDTAANVAVSTGLDEAVNVTATGVATAAQALTIEAAANSGSTSIAAVADTAAALTGLNNDVLALVTGAVTANTAATAAQAESLAAFTKVVAYNIADSVQNVLAASAAARNEAINITVNDDVTVAQAIQLQAASNSGSLSYRINDTYQNIIADADLDTAADGDEAPSALDGASAVVISHALTVEQAAQLEAMITAPVVYAIVDSDQNLASAINLDNAILTSATSVTTSAGVMLNIENVSGMGLAIVTDRAGKLALPVDLDSADYLVEASVADMTGDNAAWYAAIASTHVRVVDSYSQLTSGVPIVEATYAVEVTDAITVAQHAVVDAFLANVGNTHYSLADTAANLTAASSAARNGATDITATGTANSAQVTAILGATNTGTTTIAAATLTAAQAQALSFADGEVITALTLSGTATVAQATEIGGDVTAGHIGSVAYSLADATSTLAAAPAAMLNGATHLAGSGAATAAQAQVLLSATNTGNTTVAAVTDTPAAVAALVAGANDTVTSITATGGVATVAQADAIAALDARTGTTVTYSYTIRDTADAILGANVAVLDSTDNSGLQVTDTVTASTAASLLAIDTALTTISIASMNVADTAANLIGAASAVKAAGNGVAQVTVDGACTVAQIGQISAQYLQTGVQIGEDGLVYSLTDSFANLSALGTVGARNAAQTITLTNASLNVAQANVAENWKASGEVIYSIVDTAANVAASIDAMLGASATLRDELANAQSITLSTSALVGEAAKLSEVGIAYNIADTAENVYLAYNAVNVVAGADRGTITSAGTVTLNNGATVEQYLGTTTERGLDEIVNLVGYTLTDTADNLVAAVTNNASALAGALQVALATDEQLTVSQATSLTTLVNFNGYNGDFRIADTVDALLTADPAVLNAASSFVVQDTVANLTNPVSGLSALLLALNLTSIDVQVLSGAGGVNAADLAAIDALNGNGSISLNIEDTAAALAAVGTAVLSSAVNITATTAATVVQAAIIEAATNTGSTSYSLNDTAANLAAAASAVLNGATNITASTSATAAQATVIEGASNGGNTTYSLSDTASNLAGAASSVLSGATAITATDAATVAQADILIASGKPVSYSLADTGVNLVVGGIAAAAINGNMNVTVTGPAISVATYDAIDVANGTGTISGYSLSDTGANLVVGGTAVTAINGNVNVAVTGPAISVADYDAIDSANGSGTISGFSIADDAAAITASAARNSAVDIVVTGGATAAQTTNLLAATNAGATTIDEVTATGAEASAFVFNTTGDDTITLLTVTGTATAQQATRVGELLISDDVGSASLSVSDFYTSVQAMKQTPSGQIALSTAAAITAFGDQNPNFIDMGGFTENLTIEGLGDNDTIYGGSGNDTISGGSGDDVIRGGSGDDDINAGSGDNTVGDAGFGADTITHDDVGTVVISVTGTDIVTLTATSTGATVNSAPGVSTTVNASTSTEAVTFNGNTGNDSLLGGDGDDTINGFVGQDAVDGGAGANTLVLTATSTDLNAAANADLVNVQTVTAASAGAGVELDLGSQTDGFTIVGSDNDDTITGSSGDDDITAGAGDDAVNAGAGTNTVTDAGVGADTITHDAVGSTVVIAVTDTGTVTLTASQTGATTNSAAGVDTTVDASTSTETVTLNGNTGADTFIGGQGDDLISGDAGDDVFRFLSANFDNFDDVDGGNNDDTIEITDNATVVDFDFNNVTSVETLLLSGTGASSVTLGTDAYNAGIREVIGSTGDDRITTSSVDIQRGTLTVDLSAGGNDTVVINNGVGTTATQTDWDSNGPYVREVGDVLNGFYSDFSKYEQRNNDVADDPVSTGNYADAINKWSSGGTDAVTILGFTAGDGADFDVIETNWDGFDMSDASFVNSAVLNQTDLSGVGTGSVIELDADLSFQLVNFANLDAVAALLSNSGDGDALLSLNDGNYTVVLYSGSGAVGSGNPASAYIYHITVDEGDGLDFVSNETFDSYYDADSIELVGVLVGVGANALDSNNFA